MDSFSRARVPDLATKDTNDMIPCHDMHVGHNIRLMGLSCLP